MYLALRGGSVPAELYIYASGGYVFGLRPGSDPCLSWPQRCEQWTQSKKLLK
jgi:hypothetical protein